MQTMAVIDFETNGGYPNRGGRATEVAIVIVEDGRIVSRYESLMNAGVTVPGFITRMTGITTAMVRNAPPADEVMQEAMEFLGPLPLIAHHANFDKVFFEHECRLAGREPSNPFACTVRLARRMFQGAPNHKLGTLVEYLDIAHSGDFHRALVDAEMAAEVLLRVGERLYDDYGIADPTHEFLQMLQQTPRHDVDRALTRYVG